MLRYSHFLIYSNLHNVNVKHNTAGLTVNKKTVPNSVLTFAPSAVATGDHAFIVYFAESG